MNENNIDEKRVYTDRKDLTMANILEMYNDGDIIPQPDYQRDYVMDRKQASRLIESILLQIPIPTVYLCEESDGTLSVIDGQQRITSIVKFLSNEFELSGLEELSQYNKKKFKDLDKPEQRVIKQATLNSIVIKKESQELKYEIFARLNQGSTKLKPQELRNCIYRGSFNDMLENIVKYNHTNLQKLFIEENKRKQYQEYILRFFALRNFSAYSSSIKKTLNDFMAKHQNDTEEEIADAKKTFNSTFDIIKQVFGETAFCAYDRENKKIMKTFSGSVYDSIIVAMSFYSPHDLMAHADEIRKKVNDLKINDETYQNYTYASTGSKNRVIGRINMVYHLIGEIIGKPADGDVKRTFSQEEKEELWAQSEKHICSYCGQEILDIADAEVDHINPFSNGGATELSNGQLLHRICNREKSNKIIADDIDTVPFEDETEDDN